MCIKLPPSTHQLPREKPVPKPKPLTRWEAYAKSKGIDKKSSKAKGGEEGKAGRLVWDDQVKEWLPKFGYKKAKAEQQKNWMMEIKVMSPRCFKIFSLNFIQFQKTFVVYNILIILG